MLAPEDMVAVVLLVTFVDFDFYHSITVLSNDVEDLTAEPR